ncbi:putative membrane protein [Rhodopirellula rubra]|uniref:Putative membrane protein n=1 Tax=Aporhodopirellula rubra TaxID=980271 RepID=A0A7W5E035_9BACT|nr:DoxX family membrane protein [Aporhodopirellula rubra]MBB3207334.1 putative membrane protein [Aporhodopirellula rubra]
MTARKFSLGLLAVLFVAAGANHFVNPEVYLRIMPPSFPMPSKLVAVSGFFEIFGGVGVLVTRLRRPAGWGLVALLIAVFPANIHMALNTSQYPDIPAFLIYARLPMQFVLIAWVAYASDLRRPTPTTSHREDETARADADVTVRSEKE